MSGQEPSPVSMTQEATWTEPLSDEGESSQNVNPWARLVGTNPDFPGRDLLEQELEITIGRRSSCGVNVNHINVSGQHCKIFKKNATLAVFIQDTSTNGTTVNGKTLRKGEEAFLEDGAEIVLVPARGASRKIGFHIHMIGDKKEVTSTGPETKYSIGKVLGSGAFASVRQCFDKKTGEMFAIKCVDKKQFKLKNQSSRANALMDEVRIPKVTEIS